MLHFLAIVNLVKFPLRYISSFERVSEISGYAILWTAAGIVATTAIGTISFVQLRKKLAKRYVKVGKVSRLLFCPIKAFAAQDVDSAECTKSGLKVGILQDRMWSVVDNRGYHVDQKEVPRFVLLHPHLVEDLMCVEGPGMDTLKLKILDKIDDGAQIVKCNVFGTYIEAVDCGEEAAKWIQEFSGKPGLRIVQYVPGLKPRPAEMRGLCNLKGENYPILFQESHPFLVLSESSVEDLNSRVQEKITCLNIRPNIVIDGCEAFDEDRWKYVRIGKETTLVRTTASSKCTRITTNTKTGDNKNMEALTTLRKYRKATKPEEQAAFKYSPLFGMCYGLEAGGTVSVGDDVYAVYE